MLDLRGCVGHEGSFPAEVRRVLFYNRIRLYYPSLDLYHHYLGTPVRGQFLMYIRALRATLNQTDRSFKTCVSIQLASYMSFVIPAWLTVVRWVTTSEYLLLYVFVFLLFAPLEILKCLTLIFLF